MIPHLIIAAVIAALSFTTGWTVQSWRYGAKEAVRAQQQLVDQQLAAAAQVRRLDNTIIATNAGTARSIALRRDADAGRAALPGLHDATAAALRTAESSHAACTERAAALGELSNALADAGAELAAKAGRHASDVQTLTDGWPK